MIEAFFRNELDKDQSQLVKDYFLANPEALQNYLTEEGWVNFSTRETLPSPIADKMLLSIEKRTYQKTILRKSYFQWGSAAAVLVALVSGYMLFSHRPPASKTLIIAGNTPLKVRPEAEWKEEDNRTKETRIFTLPDASTIELSAGARLRHLANFAHDKRDLYLNGGAQFNVGKDQARPFTVHTGNLRVTALGTVFKVETTVEQEAVHLLSGKVVIRPDSLCKRKDLTEVFLVPGQSLVLNHKDAAISIIRTPQPLAGAAAGKPPVMPKVYTFDNQQLTVIFRQLGADYGVKILYHGERLKGMTFTGKWNNQKETLDDFLNTIAILNGFTVSHGKNGTRIIR